MEVEDNRKRKEIEMKKLIAFLLIGLLSVAYANKLNIIKIEEAKKIFDDGKALFLDARGAKSYKTATIMGSMNVPVKQYPSLKNLMPSDKDALIVTFCQGFKCELTDELAELLIKDGYKNVKNYKGGYPEWKENNYPLMGLVKECKETPKGDYKPKNKAVTIKGATVYPGSDDGMIDQIWFATVILDNLPANVQLVDVRKAKLFKEGHIKGAVNIPFADGKIDTSKFPRDQLVVFYCDFGIISTDAWTSLSDEENENVLYFDANIKCEGEKCTVEPNEDI